MAAKGREKKKAKYLEGEKIRTMVIRGSIREEAV